MYVSAYTIKCSFDNYKDELKKLHNFDYVEIDIDYDKHEVTLIPLVKDEEE